MPQARIIRGELTTSGFAWSESFEAEHTEIVTPFRELFPDGVVDRRFSAQLALLGDEAFARGVEKIRQAEADAVANGSALQLVTDTRLYATVGWV